jgi:hypothetical protein
MSEMGHDVYFQPSSMGVRKFVDEPGDPELESLGRRAMLPDCTPERAGWYVRKNRMLLGVTLGSREALALAHAIYSLPASDRGTINRSEQSCRLGYKL